MPHCSGSPMPNCWPTAFRPFPALSSTVSLSGSRKPSYLRARPALGWSSGRDRTSLSITGSYVTMIVRFIAHTVGAAAIACFALVQAAQAQQQPSAAAITLATQLLELKGGISAYDPAIDGVVIHHKGVMLQI